MHIEDIRSYCLAKRGAAESFPFDETVLVFKVRQKMFAWISLERPEWVVMKCDPDKAVDLRDRYDAVQPAYHMNKRHWIQVRFAALPQQLVCALLDHSYDLVVAKLSRKERAALDLAVKG